ncbi:PTS N-acetylglucosamine/galactosamine EIIA subunit, partial [Vibrio parahaemolyticus]
MITGHGHFSTGLQSTIELLAGLQAQLKYVDFTSEMSEAELHNELLKNTPQNEPVLFFCDLLGGTPFKQAVTITTET